jgi:cytochrome P450
MGNGLPLGPPVHRQLPPGPRSRLLTTLRLARDPTRHLPRWRARHGDPFTLRLATGAVVVTADASEIRRIFTADPDGFEIYSPASLAPIVGAGSLLLRSGPRHRRERRLLTPPFHGARMRAYGEVIAAVATDHLRRRARGERFSALALTQAITIDVILRTVFGVDRAERLPTFRAAIDAATRSAHPAVLFAPVLQRPLLGLGPYARLCRDQAHLCALLRGQIEAVRPHADERSDILSLMLRARYEDGAPMDDADVVDELRTLLIAGHETTSIAIAWALHWLHRHPEALARLRAELASLGPTPTAEALGALPLLEAVCHETLRLRPIVLGVVRRLRAPFELAGHRLPPGVAVMASIFLAQRDPAVFSEPDRFVPERFLERAYSPYVSFPFGGGTRRCIGAAFALFEMKVVLGTLLALADFRRLPSRHPNALVRRNLTMGPADGIPLELVAFRSR